MQDPATNVSTPDTTLLTLPTTDPLPYITFAYAVGIIAILGYVIFLMVQRNRLRQLLDTLHEG